MESASDAITERAPTQSPPTGADAFRVDQSRWSGVTGPRWIPLVVLGFGLPVAAYLWLIAHYGVNTFYADQWYNVALVGHPLSFSALWAQHAEHRMLVPNLIVVLLAHTTHLNVVFEEFVSGFIFCSAVGLFILADKRSNRATPWLFYCPVAFVLLSFVQAASTLFGFQLAWYLAILTLAVTLFLLDRVDLTTSTLIWAIAVAVIGSFSAFEGLFIWPIGLLVLYRRHASRNRMLAWVAVALVTAAAYLHNYRWTGNSYWYAHPAQTIKFFFFAVGDVVGARLGNPHSGNVAVLVLGVVIFALAGWVIVNYGVRRGEGGGLIGVSLVCFGLLFAVTFTTGRVNGGLSFAAASQYTTFDLMILAGSYMALLNPPASRLNAWRPGRSAWPVLRLIALGAVLLQIGFGTINGLSTARGLKSYQTTMSDITANIDRAPVSLVEREVLQTPAWIRQMVHVAETHRLGLFSTGAAAAYRKTGLFPEFSIVHTDILIPVDGARISGDTGLDAVVVADVSPRKALFDIRGESGSYEVIGKARATLAGWIYRWDTAKVANGTYTVRCEGFVPGREPSYSPTITLTVKNG